MTRDWLCLSLEPGLRPSRTRNAQRDLNPVQGPLRSYLRSAAQGHAEWARAAPLLRESNMSREIRGSDETNSLTFSRLFFLLCTSKTRTFCSTRTSCGVPFSIVCFVLLLFDKIFKMSEGVSRNNPKCPLTKCSCRQLNL